MAYISRLLANAREGQQHLDALSRLAATQGASVDLVVACLQVTAVLGQEAESNFGPGRVPPLGPDEERDVGQTLRLEGLDGEEEVLGGLGLEIVDGWIRRKLPTATLGTVVKE